MAENSSSSRSGLSRWAGIRPELSHENHTYTWQTLSQAGNGWRIQSFTREGGRPSSAGLLYGRRHYCSVQGSVAAAPHSFPLRRAATPVSNGVLL